MKAKFSLEYYKNKDGSERFANGSVLLDPGEYQWWHVWEMVRVNLEWKWEIFQYRTAELCGPDLVKDPGGSILWLYTMDDDWNKKAPSVFCIRASDIF